MFISQLIFVALLQLFPYMNGHNRACVMAHQEQIISSAEQGFNEYQVPQLVLMSVGFMETHLGCDASSGGNWGAPISRHQRHVAGTPMHAARALQRSFEVCGTWLGAVSRFRCGLCQCSGNEAPYPPRVMSLMNTLGRMTNTPLPSHLRHR